MDNYVQMESRNDLKFVFENLRNALKTKSGKVGLLTETEQALEEIFENVSLNCRINGKPFHEASDQPIEEFEPIDQELVSELNKIQAQVDKSLKLNCKLKNDLVNACKSVDMSSNDDVRFVEYNTNVEPDMEEIVDSKEISKDFENIVQILSQLSSKLPPLTQKTERYTAFVNDELSDEKYNAHAQRLGKVEEFPLENSNLFEAHFRQKLNESYDAAIASGEHLV